MPKHRDAPAKQQRTELGKRFGTVVGVINAFARGRRGYTGEYFEGHRLAEALDVDVGDLTVLRYRNIDIGSYARTYVFDEESNAEHMTAVVTVKREHTFSSDLISALRKEGFRRTGVFGSGSIWEKEVS